MDQVSIDILLDFLYNRFAVTFLMCLIGSLIRETMASSKKKSILNISKIVSSTVFSTFLMCACADYLKLKLQFSIYSIICILLGMWALNLVKIVMSGNFVSYILNLISKTTTDPVIKEITTSASKNDLPGAFEENNESKNKKTPGST